MSSHNAFVAPSSAGDAWFSTGLTTSFPNINASSSALLSHRFPCKDSVAPGCRIFHVPRTDSTRAVEVDFEDPEAANLLAGLKEQIIVFQYQGEFHAVDHVSCILLSVNNRYEVSAEKYRSIELESSTNTMIELSTFLVSTLARHAVRY